MEYKITFVDEEYENINDMYDLIEKIKFVKSKIDINPKKWAIIKKIINEYEYIYTSSNPTRNIADVHPYSRSYFKMKEIINTFNILKESNNIFSIAEAPGGFIQCFLDYKNNNIDATSLLSDDKRIPYWNKKLTNSDNVNFLYGINKNGDICNIKNVLSIIKNKRDYYDIITADGGFDYSVDYNNQEKDSLKLIQSEIFVALNTQKVGGSFICKIFDIFLKETIYLIYILSLSYEEILFYKPSVSRMSNSEKYIICKKYKGYNTKLVNDLFRKFNGENTYKCPKKFIDNIRMFNEYYLKKQINKIEEGIRLLNKSLKIYPTPEQVDITLEWCIKNNIKINNKCCYLNDAISR